MTVLTLGLSSKPHTRYIAVLHIHTGNQNFPTPFTSGAMAPRSCMRVFFYKSPSGKNFRTFFATSILNIESSSSGAHLHFG